MVPKKRKAPNIQHGKQFEKKVNDAFRNLYELYPCMWDRVIDSHDAGNLIRKADCDFKLVVRSNTAGTPWLVHIECKASVRYRSLSEGNAVRSLIKADQIASMRIARRAGAEGMFFFEDVERGRMEVWDADSVIASWRKQAVLSDSRPLYQVPIEDLNDFAVTFVSEFLMRG